MDDFVQMNSICNELQASSLSTFCNSSCQERLLYNASVLVEDETAFNLSLYSLASNGLFVVDGLKLMPNYGCSPVVGSGPLPLPNCPIPVPTSSQTTAHPDSSRKPTPNPLSTPTPGSSPGQTENGQSDFLVIVLILVLALFTTFVLLLLILVLIMCFVLKRKAGSQPFALDR